ncbi:hypothetical protein CERSUDRAFT_112198 [Gelatoporia subvermispora B]|uniref:RING-type domain-containing protein n=1 Tax=Ceriporiopsis subvermispora (strain B) TaxID=914234 RepID=M2QSG0_CERS8|nr:hypothetical protein CERSUDRAFT_112198 [Gelatoporia subvermispora B]
MSNRPRARSMTDALRVISFHRDIDRLMNAEADRVDAQLESFSNELPRLKESEIIELGHGDSPCPICLTQFLALVAEEETAMAMDSPAHPVEELGVTRLVQTCGHIFCRKDIRNWMREGRSTCPTCRRPFIAGVEARPTDDSRTIASIQLRPVAWPIRSAADMDLENMPWVEELVIPILDERLGSAQAGSPPRPDSPPDERPDDEDRSHFAGMYS